MILDVGVMATFRLLYQAFRIDKDFLFWIEFIEKIYTHVRAKEKNDSFGD